MYSGSVKWFDRKKGIGFVTPADAAEDVFIHRRNFTKDAATGKTFVLDEGDEIYFNLGTHEGRTTAIEISLPVGTEKKAPRRNRGRAAKKELDDEAEEVAKEEEAELQTQTGGGGGFNAPAADNAAGGGRDSKTHRRGGDRKKRNDKGVAGKGDVDKGQASSRRSDNRSEASRAAREVSS
jgi:cold shock CspA family protein